MTTRRTLIKGIPALAVAATITSTVGASSNKETAAFPYDFEHRVPSMYVGSLAHGGVVRWETDGDSEDEAEGFRCWGLDRDWDGTWCVTADARRPTCDDMGGSISVRDPKVAAFLEEFVKLMANPDGYGNVII